MHPTMLPRWILLLPFSVALLAFMAGPARGARVLMVTLGGTKSHKIPFLELGRALIRRGHSVTLMSAFPPDDASIPAAHPTPAAETHRRPHMLSTASETHLYGNSTRASVPPFHPHGRVIPNAPWGVHAVTKEGFLGPPPPPSPSEKHVSTVVEIAPPSFVHFVREFTDWDLLGRRMDGTGTNSVTEALQYAYGACRTFLGDPVTRKMIRDPSLTFDLLVADGAFPDCIVAFAHRYRIPFMYINTVVSYVLFMAHAGVPVPYPVTPFFSLPYTEEMNFFQRVHSTSLHMALTAFQWVFSELFLQRLAHEAFGPHVPNLLEFEKNVSFILQNGHASISYARPYLPLVAEVACIHCRPANPLPMDLEKFVSEGPEGFIYFSMGSSVKASNMSPTLKALFVEAFTRLSPMRVLWKWEDSNHEGLPVNVKVSQWMPQQDILGHPKIRAFVTHGGLLSMIETVFHGVPVVTMPVFCDHDLNAAKANLDGYAIKLELRGLTLDQLVDAIRRIIIEPKFKENVRYRSILLRDQPDTPLDRAIYWTEYVIRHKGAPHLQSPLRNLSMVQTYGLDVMAFFLFFTIVLLSVITLVIWFILTRLLSMVRPSERVSSSATHSLSRKTKQKVN